jgi:hypothetical protein
VTGPDPSSPTPGEPPLEDEELQRRLEQQLREVRVQDLLLESVASILNLSARRIAKADERDLEQGRIGIDAVRAVLDLIDPEPREQVRQALSQVQMLYAREVQGGEEGGEEGGGGGGGEQPPSPQPPAGGAAGAGDRPSGLWTPGRG